MAGARARARLRSELKYWTAARLADAKPVDWWRGKSNSKLPRNGFNKLDPPAHEGELFEGIPNVGTFFSAGKPVGGDETRCTGSVVHTPNKNIVLTAGHCGISMDGAKQLIFVPKYQYGKDAAHQPYGIYPVEKFYIDPRYQKNTKAPVSDLDLAFASVMANSDKQLPENVVGALTFTPSDHYDRSKVTIIGYPNDAGFNPKHKAIRCETFTDRNPLGAFRQMRMHCRHFYSGVSGGPWIENYDSANHTGNLVGNTGGYNGGGDDANHDYVTFASIYGKDAVDLFNDAKAHRVPSRPNPYKPADDVPSLPGSGSTWQHASYLAGGSFTGSSNSDLLVVWSDGETTLYPNNGNGGFLPERQLLPPNELWTNVRAITAGDFAGGNGFDLLVRWVDGEVTLYPDVSTAGLNVPGTQMAPKGSIRKNADQISAGRFVSSGYVTDLIVRWSDGELTLYSAVSSGTFGRETQLQKPNDLWQKATILTSGQYSGNTQWDLMVRWVDGELDNYVGTSTAGLGSEVRISSSEGQGTWTHDDVMTTGSFTPGGMVNDLIVRWSDGETTMYRDCKVNQIGQEARLVAPA
ncbi:trypsin-like serine peptidase [Actinomadura gamaensis]|uniref:Trypsin-like serine peptidase n=1 Tax=Actinomadura gamaensis TaxID=1763541 RepID=A0ABV9UDN1_9ACTN